MAAPEKLLPFSSVGGGPLNLINSGDLFIGESPPDLLPSSNRFTNIFFDNTPREVVFIGNSIPPEEVAHSISPPYPNSLADADLAREVTARINARNRPKISPNELLGNAIEVIDEELRRIALPLFIRMGQVGSVETAILAEIAQRASDAGAQSVDLAVDTLSTSEGRKAALRKATITGKVLLIAGGSAACAVPNPSILPSPVQTGVAAAETKAVPYVKTTQANVSNAVGTIDAVRGNIFGAETPAATGPEPKPVVPQAISTPQTPARLNAPTVSASRREPTPIRQVVIQIKPSQWPEVAKAIQNDYYWSGFEGVAQVLGPNLIVLAPYRPDIYGSSILLVIGDDGKVRDARDIANFASSTPTNYLVTHTFMSDQGKSGDRLVNPILITVNHYMPDERSQKLGELIAGGKVDDNFLRLSGPDGKPFIVYVDSTGKIMGAWDVKNARMQFPGDKGFQLAGTQPVRIVSVNPQSLGVPQEKDSEITQVRNSSGEVEYYLGPPPAPEAVVIDVKTGAPVAASADVEKAMQAADAQFRLRNYIDSGYTSLALTYGGSDTVPLFFYRDKDHSVKLGKQVDGRYELIVAGNFLSLWSPNMTSFPMYGIPEGASVFYNQQKNQLEFVGPDGNILSIQPLPGEMFIGFERAPSLDKIKPVIATNFDDDDRAFNSTFAVQAEGRGGRNGPNSGYGFPDDPTNSGHGRVYQGILNGPSPFKDGVFRPYPADAFGFKPGNYAAGAKVYLYGDVQPSTLGYGDGPWISLMTLFYAEWGPSALIQIRGDKGNYHLQIKPIDEKNASLNITANATFPTNQWVDMRVDVDVQRNLIKMYQDDILIAIAPYIAKTKGVAAVRWGLYGGKGVTYANLLNDDVWLKAGY